MWFDVYRHPCITSGGGESFPRTFETSIISGNLVSTRLQFTIGVLNGYFLETGTTIEIITGMLRFGDIYGCVLKIRYRQGPESITQSAQCITKLGRNKPELIGLPVSQLRQRLQVLVCQQLLTGE